MLKNLEELDFSKSELSGSGASRLLDGDLDFTGLPSPSTNRGNTIDDIYNMDEMPSFANQKGPTDDPFATLLNQPARPKQAPGGSVLTSEEVMEVEKDLDRAASQKDPGAPPAAGAIGPATPLFLVLYQSDRAGARFPINQGETIIGQPDDQEGFRPDIDLAPYDPIGLVALRQLRIQREGARVWATDLLQSTGTQLNGKSMTKESRTTLGLGDQLVLAAGQITLKLEVG